MSDALSYNFGGIEGAAVSGTVKELFKDFYDHNVDDGGDVDGRDFLLWQKGTHVDAGDGLLLPAVHDDGSDKSSLVVKSDAAGGSTGEDWTIIVVTDHGQLPAVQDDGLLLPAVHTDYGLLLPY